MRYKAPKAQDLYAEVSRRAAHRRDKIDIIDTQAVLIAFFDILREHDAKSALSIINSGLSKAEHRWKHRQLKSR
jgi:hypothetical protein